MRQCAGMVRLMGAEAAGSGRETRFFRPGLSAEAWHARRRRGFTLIEILVVIAIIVVLLGILILVGIEVRRKAQKNATNATFQTLTGVMEKYLKDHPEPTDANWVQQLWATDEGAKALSNLPTGSSGANKTILDGFGAAIHYVPTVRDPATKRQLKAPFFWSYGPDGLTGTDSSGDHTADDMYSAPVGTGG